MPKRKHKHSTAKGVIGLLSLRHGHLRQKRRKISFHSAIVSAMDTGQGAAKRGKHHEAEMIPGVDGHRIFGFPNSIITKLRYSTFLTLSATAGVVTSNTFAANGIFDPDISNVGHQPLYRDNYASIYDQYTVIGSKITVSFLSGSTTMGQYVGIVGDDDATTSGNLETLMEQNNSVSTQIGSINAGPTTLSLTFEPLKDFGIDAKDDGSSATTVGSNPSELWCYKLFSLGSDGTSATTTYAKVEIDYTVKFAELQTPVQN